HLGEHTPFTDRQSGADHGEVLTVSHHRGVRGNPVGAERREEHHGFGEVRLALAVAADENVRTGKEAEVGGRVIAEVDQDQVLHDPGLQPTCGGSQRTGHSARRMPSPYCPAPGAQRRRRFGCSRYLNESDPAWSTEVWLVMRTGLSLLALSFEV